ncbi:MAG: Pyruvate kinase [Parcubacteria group bacterium GW2011_GWC2_39_14]|nr:MAG: Pyruvate kinase [Parcubacteria group bacterium GW2011_GWC2_39_14]KKR55510.1 MAG: Pyruvate kinase [Parcubacteria group bacterium GW2011_GWA2_40_23]
MKRTKIVCTIGPASDKPETLKKLIKAGMNVARLNFSHNVLAYHAKVIKNIRQLAQESNQPIAIIQDLQGPRIRLGDLPLVGIELKKNTEVILTTGKRNAKKISVTYKNMHLDVKPKQRVLIADGTIELLVEKVKGQDVICRVVVEGTIFSHKGINLPDTNVRIQLFSDKDKKDLIFGVKQEVDYVALSFVRTAQDVLTLKKMIKAASIKLKKTKLDIKVIVKIEKPEAIKNFDAILAVTDAVMIARGDLGIEMSAEDIPVIQKMIINKCLHASKPVIVATQMLDSMINNPRPTRAEASDVANAVIDHTDAVMLSGETASGKYPVEAVETMSRIINKTENSVYDNMVLKEIARFATATDDVMANVVKKISTKVRPRAIIVATRSGYSARIVSRYRPEVSMWVVSENRKTAQQLNLCWGITSFVLPRVKDYEELLNQAIQYLKENKKIKAGDKLVVIAGLLELNRVEIRVA